MRLKGAAGVYLIHLLTCAFTADYIHYPKKDCPGNDIIGIGYITLDKCFMNCDANLNCVAAQHNDLAECILKHTCNFDELQDTETGNIYKKPVKCRPVEESERQDCGYPGMDRKGCIQRGCCYDGTDPPARVPRCFFPQIELESCRFPLQGRQRCGYPGISREDCINRGCCHNATHGPHTFFPQIESCIFPLQGRQRCGYSGISREDCINRGCCHNATHGPHCFSPRIGGVPIASPNNSITRVTGFTPACPDLYLKCDCDILDHTEFPITWVIWQHEESGAMNNVSSDSDWLFQSNTVKDTGFYSCQCGNLFAQSDWSNSVFVTVEVGAVFHLMNVSTEIPKYNSDAPDTLSFTCEVGASTFYDAYISHNSKSLIILYQLRLFGKGITQSREFDVTGPIMIPGNYSYGLEEKQKLEVTWRAAELPETCDNAVFYNGEYQCVVLHTYCGGFSHTREDLAQVQTKYAPISRQRMDKRYTAELGEYGVLLYCDTCANPDPISYQWYHQGSLIEIGELWFYPITTVKNSDFGNYQCQVENGIALSNISMCLLESESAGDPKHFKALPQHSTSSSLTVSWTTGSAGSHPPINHTIDIKPSSDPNSCNQSSGFEFYSSVVLGEDFEVVKLIQGLDESTPYDIRLQAHNRRDHDASSDCQYVCGASTTAIPDIRNIEYWIDTEENLITCTWEDLTMNPDLHIGLQLIISDKDSGSLVHHPGLDETVDVKMESTSIWVSDEDITYDMTVMMYEGLNTLGSVIEQGVVEPGGDASDAGLAISIIFSVLFFIAVALFIVSVKFGFIQVNAKQKWKKYLSEYQQSREREHDSQVKAEASATSNVQIVLSNEFHNLEQRNPAQPSEYLVNMFQGDIGYDDAFSEKCDAQNEDPEKYGYLEPDTGHNGYLDINPGFESEDKNSEAPMRPHSSSGDRGVSDTYQRLSEQYLTPMSVYSEIDGPTGDRPDDDLTEV